MELSKEPPSSYFPSCTLFWAQVWSTWALPVLRCGMYPVLRGSLMGHLHWASSTALTANTPKHEGAAGGGAEVCGNASCQIPVPCWEATKSYTLRAF